MPARSLDLPRHALSQPLAGRIHLLTATTQDRCPLFVDWRCAWAAAASMTQAESWPQADVLCWVLMPDQWHGLVRLQAGACLASAMRQAKGRSARAINLARGRGGRVWAVADDDRALGQDEDLLRSARHLVAHPLRAGLVARIGDYPYWDAVWLRRPGTSR